MGFNTVAVLLNDFTHELERDGSYGARIAKAMRNCGHRREKLSTSFGAGVCISQAHADYSQVVVVGKNTGRRLDDANDLDWYALKQLIDALERHGYRVKPPARRRRASAPPQSESGSE